MQRAPVGVVALLSRAAIALLKADHRKVEGLFSKFENAHSDRKQALVQEICTELCIHATIEEEIFYPACKGEIEDDDLLEESYVEHDGAMVLIAVLLDSEPDAEFYDAKVTVLSEMIKHHVKEEEKRSEGLFAQAKRELSAAKQTNDSIKFTLGKGKAKAAIESLRGQFRDAGWKEEHASMAAMAGTLSFSKEGGGSVTVTYSDTGFMPTEISLSAFRAELEAAK